MSKMFDEYGNFKTNPEYKEILKLRDALVEAGIPHEFGMMFDGWHIIYPCDGKVEASVIEHRGSYGHEDDLLEIMGLLTEEEAENDRVLGHLTCEDVFERIKKHWEGER